MERSYNRKKKSNKRKGAVARSYASKQEVRELERMQGLSKTKQFLKNVGRASTFPFLKAPEGPRPGANFTVREIASTFNGSSGVTNLGGIAAGTLVINSATALLFAISFRLDDLANLAAYSALFDQYRIERIRCHFRARNNAGLMANVGTPNAAVPTGYLVVDRDDATAPTTYGALQQYNNAIAFNGYESAFVDLIPSITPSAFSGGAFSGYTVKDSDAVWIDIANTGVPVYGIKGGMSGLTLSTTSTWVWDIIPEYIVSFRKTR